MVQIKPMVEMIKEDTVLRFAQGDKVMCVTIEGKLYIGTIEMIGEYEGKEAIRLNTSDVNNSYKYTSVVIFVDDIEYIIEENDANKETIFGLLWEQSKEDFINSFAELGFDISKIELLYEKVKNVSNINDVSMASLVKCLVYSVENDASFKEYLLGIE